MSSWRDLSVRVCSQLSKAEIADNDLKLVTIYKNLKNDDRAAQVRREGQLYLAESLKSVKTEWANQIKKGFEN